MSAAPEDKICARCGRPFAWRKKWAREWEHVKYCSDACRRGAAAVGATMDAAVMAVLEARAAGASVDLAEVSRAVDPKRWRERLVDVRAAAVRLALAGRVVLTQGGVVVDPLRVRGDVRLGRA